MTGGAGGQRMTAQETLLAGAGRRVRARMRELYPSLREGAASAPAFSDPPVPTSDLEGVTFAHPTAWALAEEGGLTWADFANSAYPATGANGYRTEDVRRILKERVDHAG